MLIVGSLNVHEFFCPQWSFLALECLQYFLKKFSPPPLKSQVVHPLQDQNVVQQTGCESEENHLLSANVLMQQQSLKTDTERNEKTIHTWADRVPFTPMTRYS